MKSKLYIDAPTLVASTLVLAANSFTTSRMECELTQYSRSNLDLVPERVTKSAESPFVKQVADKVPFWKAEYSQRFQRLSRKEARGEISIQEWAELERLTEFRRAKKYPRTADEILLRRKQTGATAQLLAAIKNYIDAHTQTSNNSEESEIGIS